MFHILEFLCPKCLLNNWGVLKQYPRQDHNITELKVRLLLVHWWFQKAPTSFENKDGVQIHFSILNEIFLLVFNIPLIILFVDWLYFHGFSYFSWNILIIFSYLREKKKS